MADFPALNPSGRLLQMPRQAMTRMRALNGYEGRVRHGAQAEDGRVTLTFKALSEANLLAIATHYRGQRGRIQPFDLPIAVWSGLDADPTPAGHQWRYLERPTFDPVGCDYWDVTVTLETARIMVPVLQGLDLVINLSVAEGDGEPGGGGYTPADSDAAAYITAVEAADGTTLEDGVKEAIDDFVIGCKSDGIWANIQAACILAGARTLAGALVPLKGAAPTNNGFVGGDYNRETGLIGNGSSKYLNSNRADNADGQDNSHLAVYVSTASSNSSGTAAWYAGVGQFPTTPFSYRGISRHNNISSLTNVAGFSRTDSPSAIGTLNATGFMGVSRSGSSSYAYRAGGAGGTATGTSLTPSANTIKVFAVSEAGAAYSFANGRIAFYSAGGNLALATLEGRVNTLMTDIAAAIP
jgi:hypothetical protein